MKSLYDYLHMIGITCSYCNPPCFESPFGLRYCLIGELRADTRKSMIDIAFEMLLRGEY